MTLKFEAIDDVVELYGNAFRDRCGAWLKLRSNACGICLACKSPWPSIRPDIVLEGEHVDGRLLAGAELSFKRADVVLVVDAQAAASPAASLIEKARVRAARIVRLGGEIRTHDGLTSLTVTAPADVFARALADALDAPTQPDFDGELSADGFAAYLFLSGQGTDNTGVTLEQALAWKDWEVPRHLVTIPWMVPLPTPSQMNPAAPMPLQDDYRLLAADEAVHDGFRRSFNLMLRFYGFQWSDNCVARAVNWRVGFANWALSPGPHDLFISRILGALTRGGLKDEATAFVTTLELEARQFRPDSADGALWHWRLAVACQVPARSVTIAPVKEPSSRGASHVVHDLCTTWRQF